MSKSKEFYVSTSEAQKNISKILQFVENENDQFIVTRYSKPIGVIVPFDEYKKLKQMAKYAKGGACQKCNL
jgi:prevent-host-death family protein